MRFLEFEKPIAELEQKVEELRSLSGTKNLNIAQEINKIQSKAHKLLAKTYSSLTPWQKVLVARHEERPQFLDYLEKMTSDFTELSGDRVFGEDCAIIGGVGHFNKRPVLILGQQKGTDTESRLRHNFGMARPEGYRKAARLMELAERFRLPILCFVNTAGAYPGIESEERGQAIAIAQCILTSARVNVPVISVVIGEGGSGGALALATANRVLMMEHSFYSVISPEGCASILWKSASANATAAAAQRLTAQDLLQLGLIDSIIPEPIGGAHRDKSAAIQAVLQAIEAALSGALQNPRGDFQRARVEKFTQFGQAI